MSENTLLILVKMPMTTKMNGSWDCFPTYTEMLERVIYCIPVCYLYGYR